MLSYVLSVDDVRGFSIMERWILFAKYILHVYANLNNLKLIVHIVEIIGKCFRIFSNMFEDKSQTANKKRECDAFAYFPRRFHYPNPSTRRITRLCTRKVRQNGTNSIESIWFLPYTLYTVQTFVSITTQRKACAIYTSEHNLDTKILDRILYLSSYFCSAK